MTTVTNLSSRRAASATSSIESLETIQLHAQAHNALSAALHFLRQPDCTPEQVQAATARAVRGATLLKRAATAAKFSRMEG